MLDYCCYGSMVARWYIGEQALAVIGMPANLNSHWGDADDNAAMMVRFPGAMALFEGSWTTIDYGVAPGPIVYGTGGTLAVERPKGGAERVRVVKAGAKAANMPPNPWRVNHKISPRHLSITWTMAPLDRTLDLDFNLEAMAILDAGVRARGKWQIGAGRECDLVSGGIKKAIHEAGTPWVRRGTKF